MRRHHPALLRLSLLGAVWLCCAATPAQAGSQNFDKGMEAILADYLKIHDALAADHMKGVSEAAQAIAAKAKKLDVRTVTGEHARHYKDLPSKLQAAAADLGTKNDLAEARESFKALSRPMAMWASMSEQSKVSVVYCSMAKGSWLQRAGSIRNPYHGKSMLGCGEVVGGAGYKGRGGH